MFVYEDTSTLKKSIDYGALVIVVIAFDLEYSDFHSQIVVSSTDSALFVVDLTASPVFLPISEGTKVKFAAVVIKHSLIVAFFIWVLTKVNAILIFFY